MLTVFGQEYVSVDPIIFHNLKCKDNLILFIRANGNLACANLSSMSKLAERGIMLTDDNATIPTVKNPINVNNLIQNLDSLYGKRVIVYGDYQWRYNSPIGGVMCYQSNKTYDDSGYIPRYFSNSHLANATSTQSYNRIELQLKTSMSNNYMSGLFDSERPVALSGILNKVYVQWCQPDHYVKSASLLVDLHKISSKKDCCSIGK